MTCELLRDDWRRGLHLDTWCSEHGPHSGPVFSVSIIWDGTKETVWVNDAKFPDRKSAGAEVARQTKVWKEAHD